MVDFETLANSLRKFGHKVERPMEIPANAGSFELMVDGKLLTLAEARGLLVSEEAK